MNANIAVHFSVSFAQANAHVFTISLELSAHARQKFSLPVWTPGSYMVREFSQHIVRIQATQGQRAVSVNKIDKNTFVVDNEPGNLIVDYQVYAYDSSIRASFIDNTQAFFNGTTLFLRPHDFEGSPFRLTLMKENSNWTVATGLTALNVDQSGFGTYHAKNYDELVDCPVQVSPMERLSFDANGVPHEIVLVGDVRAHSRERLQRDLTLLCEKILNMFSHKPPFERYLFIARFEEGGFGGLEHQNSTMLLNNPYSLPSDFVSEADAHYRSFLSLCSHEYFHAWNVKSIKPKTFVPYNYDQECYTDLLWLFEGFTAYYDDLMVCRAGLISKSSYLSLLSKSLTQLMRTPGRHHQSLHDASFDAWIKFYRPHEGTPNHTISYYLKGSIFALFLDLSLRWESNNNLSLDHIMAALYEKFGDGRGVEAPDFWSVLKAKCARTPEGLFEAFISGTEEIPVLPLLEKFGISFALSSDDEYPPNSMRDSKKSAYFGFRHRFEHTKAIISFVEANSPAEEAGLSPLDEIIGINNVRFDEKNATDLLNSLTASENCSFLINRRKKISTFMVKPKPKPLDVVRLSIKKDIPASELCLLEGWLT